MKVKIKILKDGAVVPKKAHPTDAAWDLYVPDDVALRYGRQVIDLGFAMELPHGYAATIDPRSGFSSKGMECVGLRVDADVVRGLVDEPYRGSVGVIVVCRDTRLMASPEIIKKGTRIAQMQIVPIPDMEMVEVAELSDSDRGRQGFGSTGS